MRRSADRKPTPTNATEGAGGSIDPVISVDASTDKFVFERDFVETADVDRVEEEVESVPPRARTRPITLVATAPLRRPTPWLKIALIAGGLCVVAAGWLVHRMEIADHETAAAPAAQSGEELAQERRRSQELERQLAARQGERDALAQERARLEQQLGAQQNDQRLQATLAQKRTRDQAIEQQLAGRRDQEALVWERARSQELEHQLAARQGEHDALAKERARSKILEQQLAARQGDQDALAKERAHSQELEQQLAVRQGDQDALAKERARRKDLEQRLAVRQTEQDALAKERARGKELEQQVAAHQGEEKALEQQLAARQGEREALTKERARSQELEQKLAARQSDQDALVKERARSKELEQQLAARQSGEKALTEERARSKGLEQQLAARQGDQEALALERARSLALERELVKHRDTMTIPPPAFELIPTWPALALPSINPAPPPPREAMAMPMPAAPTDKPVVDKAPFDKSAGDKPVIVQPPQASGNAEATRLMARAKLLLEQGDVVAARSVLVRAAETGSAQALFSLAETYDPAVLSAWGTVGTQGDAAKSQKLYADALAGGFLPAKDRLRASR